MDLGVRTDHILGFYVDSVPLMKDPTQSNTNSYYRRDSCQRSSGVPGVVACVRDDLFASRYLARTKIPSPLPASRGVCEPVAAPERGLPKGHARLFRDLWNSNRQEGERLPTVTTCLQRKGRHGQRGLCRIRFLKGLDPLQQRVVMEQVIPNSANLGPPVEWRIVGVFHTVKSRGFARRQS